MTEIVKADKKLKRQAYILLIIVVVIAIFTQSDFFSSLVNVDTTGMDANQKFEATQQELVYAMIVTAFWFLVIAYFSFRIISLAKQTFIEKRFPPLNYRVAIDTKVIYGKKAKIRAYFMIAGAIIFLINPLIRVYSIYWGYSVIGEVAESSVKFQSTMAKHYQKLVDGNPNSIEAIHYYFQMGKTDKAVKLMDSLIQNGSSEALFAKASEGLKGENLPKELDKNINTLTLMCNDYVEPCLLLAIHNREEKNYDISLEYFLKAASKDYAHVYREIRYLYNRLNLNDRDKLNEYTDKMNSAKSSLCDEIYCLTKH